MLDTISKYVYEVYRSKSVSKAAKKLYISQPALSSAIKKAEENIGAKIFNRKTLPFTVTPEGKVYIDTIEKIMNLEKSTIDRIQDIQKLEHGVLNIATSTNLSYYVIPKICEQFHKKHPGIDINILMTSTSSLCDMLRANTADLIFVPTEEDAFGFNVFPLLEENIIVAVRRDFKGIEKLLEFSLSYSDVINKNIPDSKKISDMSVFHGIEFIYSPPDSNIFKKRKLIFGETAEAGYINAMSVNQRLNYNLMRSGFGAYLTTDADIATMPEDKNCCYFALKSPAANQNFSIAHAKDSSSPSYKIVAEFTELTQAFFSVDNPLQNISP